MSNKITLSTIQFRADTHGVNPALDSLRQSSKDAHDQVDRLQEALSKGIKTIKDMNGIDIEVSDASLRKAKRAADDFDNSIKELMKGATALESVVKNISLGTIEKNSRAELKGAINAANSRLRSIKEMQESGVIDEESLQRQRELNIVILESQKQLNNLDRDTQKFLETIEKGETISESALNKEIKGLKEMLSLIPKGTDEWNKYNDLLTKIEAHVAEMRKQEREAASALLSSKDLGQYSEDDIRRAITNGKELLATYKTNSDEAKNLAANIVRAEQYLKNYGVEAARAAAREQEQLQLEQELAKTMNKRLRDLKNLSADALAETRRYWEAQKNGAAEGTEEFNKAEAALKKVDGYQRGARRTELGNILGDPSKFGVAEVKNAVQEAEKLRDSVQKGIPVWHQYNKMVEQGKQYLDNLAKTEAAERIEKQMADLNSLSAAGLQEVKKYWETMVAGAKHGSDELDTYKAKLEQVTAEEKARNAAAAEQKVGILSGGASNLRNFSETEVRQAIEAGNQLIKTYKVASPEAQQLAKNIVAAEEYLKQYGLEAERAAAREREAMKKAADQRAEMNQAMIRQLADTRNITPEILKAQEQYWQKLINDPKTARDSLATYKNMLEQVHQLQAAMVKGQGEAALNFFRRDHSYASANDVKQQAEALKKYRDSLPQASNAALIQEIDGYLAKTGKTAEASTKELEKMMEVTKAVGLSANAGKTAYGIDEKEMMQISFLRDQQKYLQEMLELVPKGSEAWKSVNKQLEEVNLQLNKLPFSGTVEDLRNAQKSIEAAIATTDKGSSKYQRLQQALARVKAEMAGTGISAQKTQEVLANPKAEKNVNTLKNAVARARAELEVMGQRIERMRSLMAQAEMGGNDKWAKRLKQAIKETSKQYDELTESTKRADQAQKELAATSKGTATAFEKAWSRLKTYITLYMGAAVAIQKITATMGDLMVLSDKMGEVRKTTGFTADEVGRLSDNLAKLDTRTNLTGLMEFSSLAGSIGLKTQEAVQGFTEAANMIAVSLPEMGNEASRTLMKIADATGDLEKNGGNVRETLERVGSTIIALRANSAAAAGPITDFVSRVGAVGAQAGISIDQIAALGATVDALGGRVEMSATALSRMIPAIKNNSFAVAQALQIPESQLKAMNGMDQMVAVFRKLHDSVKGFDTSTEEGMNAMADSVEKALGRSTSMQEVMKQLNQQGARAGIVFGLLSQNVDKLEEQLNTASNAYEENIALMDEYNKMNDTTAAKWEKLKNQFEEFFVSDSNQRFLGGVIDILRLLVNILTWNVGPALRLVSGLLHTFIAYWTVLKLGLGEAIFIKAVDGFKAMGNGLTGLISKTQAYIKYNILLKRAQDEEAKAAIQARIANEGLNKSVLANVWVAAAAAVVALGIAMYKWTQQMNRTANALAEAEANLTSTTREAGMLFSKYSQLIKKQDELKQSTNSLKEREAKLKEETEELRKKTGEGAEQSDKFKKKQEDLAKAHDEVTDKPRRTEPAAHGDPPV